MAEMVKLDVIEPILTSTPLLSLPELRVSYICSLNIKILYITREGGGTFQLHAKYLNTVSFCCSSKSTCISELEDNLSSS